MKFSCNRNKISHKVDEEYGRCVARKMDIMKRARPDVLEEMNELEAQAAEFGTEFKEKVDNQ